MRVSNQRVVINKGAVSLTMSSNTAVVVSLGISIGFGFSLTALTSKVHKWGDFMTMVNNGSSSVSYWSNMMDKRSHMMHHWDRVDFIRHNSWCFNNRLYNGSMSNSMSNW